MASGEYPVEYEHPELREWRLKATSAARPGQGPIAVAIPLPPRWAGEIGRLAGRGALFFYFRPVPLSEARGRAYRWARSRVR